MIGKVYIYALCEPDTEEVRYVGVTQQPQMRLNAHLSRSQLKGETSKQQWLKDLREKGLRPKFCILEEVSMVSDYKEMRLHERKWIHEYLSNGANLTNIADNFHLLKHGRKRPRISHRITLQTPEVRDAQGNVYWSPAKAMEYLSIKESTLRKRTAQLTRYHPEENRKLIYFKKEDIEALRNAPIRMIPFEPPEKERPAA